MSYKFNPFTGNFDDTGSGSGSDPRVDDLIILSGVPVNSQDLGLFSGSIISDNSTIKDALQELETFIEALPDPIVYRGVWDADTNSPALADGAGTAGDLYRVTVAGTQDLGSGPIDFEVGDSVVYDGSIWQKWDMTDAVSSVNGQVGAVVLEADDIDLAAGYSPLAGVVASGDSIQEAIEKLDGNISNHELLTSPGRLLYVDNTRSDSYTENGSSIRPYKTLQAAIDAASLNGDGGSVPYSFALASGTYSENVSLNNKGLFSVSIVGLGRVAINPAAGNALTSDTDNTDLQDLVVNNIEFGKPIVLVGSSTANQFKTTEFKNCSFSSAAVINATTLNNLAFSDIYCEAAINLVNVNYSFVRSGQIQGLLSVSMNDSVTAPANGLVGGMNLLSMMVNNIALITSGTVTLNFAPHSSRIGTTAGAYTIPANCNVIAYNSNLRGTWTNNGSLSLRNSHAENDILGTAPVITGNRSSQNFYDNTTSGLVAANVQEAIDEIRMTIAAGDTEAIYVSPSGDDTTGTGSILYPVQSLNKAVTLVTNPALNYIIRLAPGIYSGDPVAWPANCDLQGSGSSSQVQNQINYIAASGSETAFNMSMVSVGDLYLDFTDANIALPTLYDGTFGITRVDTLGQGPWAVRVNDSTLGDCEFSGNNLLSNCLFVSSCLIKSTGTLLCSDTIIGIQLDMEENSVIQVTGCAVPGALNGLGPGNSIVSTDAGSLTGTTLVNMTVILNDKALRIDYDNTTSGLVASNVQDAIDELASAPPAVQSKTEQIVLDGTDITNQYVTLAEIPLEVTEVSLDIIGGCAQQYGLDFSVTGQQLDFLGDLAIGGAIELEAGDVLRIMYKY